MNDAEHQSTVSSFKVLCFVGPSIHSDLQNLQAFFVCCYHVHHLSHLVRPVSLFVTIRISQMSAYVGFRWGTTSPTTLKDPWPLVVTMATDPFAYCILKVRAKELKSNCETGSDRLIGRQVGCENSHSEESPCTLVWTLQRHLCFLPCSLSLHLLSDQLY